MSKDSKTGQRANRQTKLTKVIVERHYVGTEKMETGFKRIAEEQITKKVKEIVLIDYGKLQADVEADNETLEDVVTRLFIEE